MPWGPQPGTTPHSLPLYTDTGIANTEMQIGGLAEPDEVIMNWGVIYLARKKKKKKQLPHFLQLHCKL